MTRRLHLQAISLGLVVLATLLVITAPTLPRHDLVRTHGEVDANQTSPLIGPADFSITASPNSTTLTPGSSTTVTIALTSMNGLAGTVVLSALFLPLDGAFNPPSVVLVSGGTNSSILTIVAPLGLSPGDYSIFITAASGCFLSHNLFVSLDITGPDFSITPSQSALTLSPGSSGVSSIVFRSLNGFIGSISVSASVVPLTSSVAAIPNSTTVNLSNSGPASFPLTLKALPGANPGNYTVGLVASSGTLINATQILVTVPGPDFVLSASIPVLTLIPGGASNTTAITLSPLSGFSSTVMLNSSLLENSNLSRTFSLTQLIPPSTTSSALTIAAPLGTVPGNYTVDITGTKLGGSLARDTFVLVDVKGPDFQIFAVPSFVSVSTGHAGCISTIQVVALDGFAGSVALTTDTMGSGLTAKLSGTTISGSGSVTVTVSAGKAVPGSYDVDIISQSGSIGQLATISVLVSGPDFRLSTSPSSVTVNAGGPPVSVTLAVTAVNKFAGIVSLTNSTTDFVPGISTTVSPMAVTGSGTATVTISAASSVIPSNDYSAEIIGVSGQLFHVAVISITVVGPDFTLSASPTLVNVNTGSNGTATITVAPVLKFKTTVDLAAFPSGNLTAVIQPTTILNASGTAILTVNSTIPGFYTVDVEGSTSTGIIHDIIVDVNVTAPTIHDFSISASPSSLAALAGVTDTATISVNPLGGFTGTVALTSSVSPSGMNCALNPTSVTLATSQTSTLSCSSTTATTYTVTVNGISGPLSHSVTVAITVTDFTITSTSPSALSVGTSATSTITISPVNGFPGTVSLTDMVPAGLGCEAITPAIIANSGTATVSCKAMVAGNYVLTVTGSDGSLSHAATASFIATDFTIVATSPAAATVGTSATSTITITAVNSFTGTVALADTIPAGLTCGTITPSNVANSGTATVSCTAMIAANYVISVAGTAGTLSHSATVILTVTDFLIAATSPATANTRVSSASAITITALNGFTGAVSLTDVVPSGLTCGAIDPLSVTNSGTSTVSCSATVAANYVLTVTGTTGTLSHSATATFTVQDFTIEATSPSGTPSASLTSTITIAALNGFAETVSLTDLIPAGLTCGVIAPSSVSGSGTATLMCSATTANVFSVIITGMSGTLSHSATATFTTTSDFTISATSPAAVKVGTSATSTITVSAVNGFTGTISLADTVPADLTCGAITPMTVINSGTAFVSCSATATTNYVLTVTGTSSSLSHSATVAFTVTDFTLTATSLSTPINVAASSTITVTALNGFSETVALTDTVPAGLTCGAITPSSFTGSGTATLSCSSATSGAFAVTITGTSGSDVHTQTATWDVGGVKDFTIAATSPAAVTVGVSATSTITVIAVNGFTGTISLTETVPTGLTCGAITPNSVTLGTSGTATVSCSAAVAGNYIFTLTAMSGTLFHSQITTFAVTDFTIVATSPSGGQSSSLASTITVAVVNGFAGTVSLTDTIPSALTCGDITPNSVTNSGTGTLSCTATEANTYAVTIIGTSGSLSHFATATFTVGVADFSISASSVTVNAGTSGTTTITANAIGSFTGSIGLADTVPTGLTCAPITPSVISGSGTATVSCSAIIAGNYTLKITSIGTTPPFTHSITVTFTVQDFTVTTNNSGPVDVGDSAIVTVNVAPINGFSGSVVLIVAAQSGLSCGTLSHPTLSLPSQLASTVTCSAAESGNYTVTITAASAQRRQQAATTITVSPISQVAPQPKIAGLDPTEIYAIVGLIAVLLVAGLVVTLRSRASSSRKKD